MCENEIKKGSTVILKCNIGFFLGYQIPEGTRGFVLENATSPFVEFDIKPNKFLHDGGGLGEEGKCWSVHINYLKLYEYKQSNRHKLQQAIKETGYSSRRLSDIAVGNESYFYNYTGKARFDKKGDISSETLDNLKITLEYAVKELSNKLTDALIHEREDLDLAPKTVDENNVPVVEKSIDESVAEAKVALNTFSNNTQKTIELQKKDAKVRNFLIVFLIFIVILSIYFFTR